MFSAFLIFLALIGCEVFLSFYYNNKSKEEISVTQLFTSIPLNKDNKTFITISPVRRWEEEFAVRGALFNCSIFNNTKHDFKEWKIKIKIPDDCRIVSSWNCTTKIEDRHLYISPDEAGDIDYVASMGFLSCGFIISGTEDLTVKNINYSGKIIYKLTDTLLNNIIILLIISEFVAIIITLIVHALMQKRIDALKVQKERDNKIIEQTMKTFVNFIDAKDEYTRGHSTRVAEYARAIAKQMGFDEEFQQNIFYMGLMHDIGKITIPDSILNKTSHLSTDEWEIIKMHTSNGAKLLKDFYILPEIGDAALYHHERYDGKGYLSQIKGLEIPLSARIICVADSFDAMNTNRCYRLKYSKDRIIQEFERCSLKQFDPDVAKALIVLLKDNKLCTS